jgi:hypothetical protein
VYNSSGFAPIVEINKSEILSITKRGKKLNGSTGLSYKIGRSLFYFGAGTISSSLFIEDADNANNLIVLGLAEMVAGVAISKIFYQRALVTNESCPFYKPKNRVWEIQ